MANLVVVKYVPSQHASPRQGIVYQDGIVKIENVRFSYPHLDKPYAGKKQREGAEPKFGIVGMLSKQTHVAMKEELMTIIRQIEADNGKKGQPLRIPMKDRFFRNGDDEKEAAYAGHWIVSAREARQPSVRDERGILVTEPHKIRDLIVGGYYGHMLIRPWFQNNDFGQKINANLLGVQFVRKGEEFGEGRINDEEAWGDESSASGDDGMGQTANVADDM